MSDHSTSQSMHMQSPEERQRRDCQHIETGRKVTEGMYACVCVCICKQIYGGHIYTFMLSVMCLLGKVSHIPVWLLEKQDLVSKLGKFQANKDALGHLTPGP